LFIFIPYLYLEKPQVNPEEYYFQTISTNYKHLDENLLMKMFEMRLNNNRQSLFVYLVLIATFTLTIAFNPEAAIILKTPIILGITVHIFYLIVGIIGLIILVYFSFRMDRFTLKEMEILFKAREKLNNFKEKDKLQLLSEQEPN